MAALKENLLSPWHVHETRDRLTFDCFRRDREEGLRKCETRRMELQGDILNRQWDKHLEQVRGLGILLRETVGIQTENLVVGCFSSRAVRLQRRWQELSERESRARWHNQQLLQDFHRAQDTLGEMVARTATMNTIRLEYARYLQENSPRWDRLLVENAQKKRVAECQKDSLKRREEEDVAASFTRERVSPLRENTHWQRATSVHEDSWGADSRAHGFVPPKMSSSSWPNPALKSHDALRFYSPTMVPQTCPFQVHHQTSPWPGPPSSRGPQTPWSPLPAWASSVVGLPRGLNAPWASQSIAGPSGWGLMPGLGAEGVGGMAPNGQGGTSEPKCLPQELDIKPVRLSSAHGDSSDGSRDSGSGGNLGDRRKRRKEGRQHSDADRKSSSQESAGTSSADTDVIPTRGKRATKGQESSAVSETGSSSTSRCGGLAVQEQRAKKKSGSYKEKSCKTLRAKSQSQVEEFCHTTEDEHLTDQSEGSRTESGHQEEDSVSVGTESNRRQAAATERAGEKADEEVQEDPGGTDGDVKHTAEDTSDENEENCLTEEGEDEEESQREENKEEEGKRGEDNETDSQEARPGSSESEGEHAAMLQAKEEEQETEKEFQAEIEDEVVDVDEEEEVDGGVDIEKPGQGSQASDSEESDSDDSIISPQDHRSIKKVQSISKAEREEGESRGGKSTVEHSDSDDDGIEHLVAPQVETQRKQENEPIDKTKVTKEVSWIEESLSGESEVKTAEDTDDEFDHFYD